MQSETLESVPILGAGPVARNARNNLEIEHLSNVVGAVESVKPLHGAGPIARHVRDTLELERLNHAVGDLGVGPHTWRGSGS